jgi:DNA polymerase-1
MDDGLPYALLRGRYMKASARMEFAGVPLDAELLERLKHYWPEIQDELIADVDKDYGVYEGRTFKRSLFIQLLARLGIPWISLELTRDEREAGKREVPDLSDDAFKEMARRHPDEIAPLKELRADLSAMRLIDLTVGKDGRNRTILSAFRARTSRNQPSNSKFIFAPASSSEA